MKKIDYRDIDSLKNDYLDAFQDWRDRYQLEWSNLRMDVSDLQVFPDLLSDILIAKIENLVNWYYQYVRMNINEASVGRIKTIFKYKEQNQSRISEFFMDHNGELELGTCYYCETAYINSYLSGKRKRNHFDIDHFLPKSICPITALSLFNLVPSCPICNERLKRNNILGDTAEETTMHCPTSDIYDFEEQVSICVIPTEAYHSIHYSNNPDMYKIQFVTRSKEYEKEIKMFKLNDRYDFHKCEALRLMDLKQDYPDSHIRMIADLLDREKGYVKECIFGDHFVDEKRRVFAKLHRDILKDY